MPWRRNSGTTSTATHASGAPAGRSATARPTTLPSTLATSFVQSALKGDFRTAEKYLVDDSLNKQDLEQVARLNERLTKQEKDSYSGATVHIHEHRKVNDSTSIISYSNSYRNKVDSLKVVKLNGKWLVDFKYIFNQHTDTLQ